MGTRGAQLCSAENARERFVNSQRGRLVGAGVRSVWCLWVEPPACRLAGEALYRGNRVIANDLRTNDLKSQSNRDEGSRQTF